MLQADLAQLQKVQTGEIKPVCGVCGERAVSMRREVESDGAEQGTDPKTGRQIMFERFKPGAMKWFCKAHVPAKKETTNADQVSARVQRPCGG